MSSASGRRVLLGTPIPRRRGLRHSSHYPHLGLASMAAVLLEAGARVRIFDGVLTPSLGAWRDALESFRPDLVGLSAYTCEVKAAHELALITHRLLPGSRVVVGGPHPTALPVQTLEELPAFDFAVKGEGELAMERLCRWLDDSQGIRQIPGIAWRRGSAVEVNPPAEPVDLARLPMPAWELFDLRRYRSMAFLKGEQLDGTQSFRVETIRGCPHRCTFCSHVLGRQVRKRAPAQVLEEIRHLQRRFGARSITFAADTFTVNRAYALKLCEALSSLEPPIQWFCGTRADCLDPELMAAMRRAGCDSIALGVESGSQRVLDSVLKGATLEQIHSTVAELKRLGFVVTANFIVGLPADDRGTILQTIDLALALDLDYATFTLFTPFPGAPLTATVEATEGYGILARDWDLFDTQSPRYLIRHPALPGWQVELLHRWAYARFYLRPAHFSKLLRAVTPRSILDYALETLLGPRPGRARAG